jgi:pilus assembly protein CpaF
MQAIREQICSAINIIVQQTRFSCGTRRVTYITEVTGIEKDIVQMQNIFLFRQEGFEANGKVKGYFEATGHIPDFYQDLIKRGIGVDTGIFAVPTTSDQLSARRG